MMKKPFGLLLLVLMIISFAVSVRAVPMQDLFDGQDLTVGDKNFFDWELIYAVSTDPQFDPDFDQIDVVGLNNQSLNIGLRFDSNDQLSVTDDNFLDVAFSYYVATVDPKAFIIENSLAITDFNLGGFGDPLIVIVEDAFTDSGGYLLASKLVAVDSQSSDLFDFAEFSAQQLIYVENNILVAGLFPGDYANLVSFEQNFTQVVPEPSTLLLIVTGLTVIAGFRKKFKN